MDAEHRKQSRLTWGFHDRHMFWEWMCGNGCTMMLMWTESNITMPIYVRAKWTNGSAGPERNIRIRQLSHTTHSYEVEALITDDVADWQKRFGLPPKMDWGGWVLLTAVFNKDGKFSGTIVPMSANRIHPDWA